MKVAERFETTGGATFQKEQTDSGARYRKNGKFVSQQQYAAGKSHTGEAEYIKRGNKGGIDAVDDIAELGHPYDAELTQNVNAFERGTEARKRAAETNRWLGFKHSEDTPDDPREAAEQYAEMKDELEQATTPDEEQDIKQQYNIGGS